VKPTSLHRQPLSELKQHVMTATFLTYYITSLQASIHDAPAS
jgi:hypothetical protein